LLLIAAIGLAYAPVRNNGFVFDDGDYIVHNPHVQAGLNGSSIAWAFTTSRSSNWHPLTWLSLQLDYTLFDMQPWGYHLTNLVLHLANTLLLFALLTKMTWAVWRSALVAALFALHPLHVESVAWAAERKDVLSTFFGLLAMFAYAGYATQPRGARYLLVVAAFALSLLAKPMLVTLPFLLLLLDWWPLGRLRTLSPVPLIGEKVPLLLLAGASCVATWYAQGQGHSVQTFGQLPLSARAANAVVAYVVYLRKMVWPDDLAAFYPHAGASLSTAAVAGAALLLVAITAAVLVWRRAPYLAVGWFWYLGTLVPVIGLVQVGSQGLADRYTYVPLIGIFIGLVWGGADLVAGRSALERGLMAATALILLLLCGLLTWLQIHYWRDGPTLWAQAIRVVPDNAFAHTNLALSLLEHATPEDEEVAFQHFARAVVLEPYQVGGNLGLAALLQKRGLLDEATARFREVLRLETGNAAAERGLGTVLAMRRQWQQAESHLRTAVRLDPEAAENYYLLAEVLQQQGKREESLVYFESAIELRPRSVAYHCALALALHEAGDKERARAHYAEAARLDPSWPHAANQAARRLACAAEAKSRDGALAVKLATQACQATGDRQPQFLDTLAAAYAEIGRYEDARMTVQKALALAEASGQAALVGELQTRLHLYKHHQPLREPSSRKLP
jgi:tetratricopeptide (TPR) repeat protein